MYGREQIALRNGPLRRGRRDVASLRRSPGSRGVRCPRRPVARPGMTELQVRCSSSGLWLAVSITAGRSSEPLAKYTRSVEAAGAEIDDVTPTDVAPSVMAAASSGDGYPAIAAEEDGREVGPYGEQAHPIRRAMLASSSSGDHPRARRTP